MTESPEPLPGGISVHGYVVAFLDLLGLAKQLRKLDSLPDYPSKEAFLPVVQSSIGVIDAMRHFVHDIYKAIDDRPETKAPGPIPEDLEGRWRIIQNQLRDHRTVLQWFGDTVVISAPFKKEDEFFNTAGISYMFSCTAATCLTMLAFGYPIRGGIEIGFGAQRYQHEVLSSAAVHAHEMESKYAVVPRVLIGKNLLGILRKIRDSEPDTLEKQVASGLADSCLELLCFDRDGRTIVDFLHPSVVGHLGSYQGVNLVYRSVATVWGQLRDRGKADIRTIEKYLWLRDYLNSRVQHLQCIREATASFNVAMAANQNE